MDKTKVKNLRDLVAAAAELYGDKTFIKEKAGKDIAEKSFKQMYNDAISAPFLRAASSFLWTLSCPAPICASFCNEPT